VKPQGNMKIGALIVAAALAPSRSEAERLMKQKAVEWDGAAVTNPTHAFDSNQAGDHTLRVGKKPAVLIRIR
jgi:tyrosyl-tRNA synthetase